MKYNKDHIYSTGNTLKVTVSQTGSKAMIREQGQDKATLRQGYRVQVDGETIAIGDWHESEQDVMLKAIRYESYAHLAYRELYNDLLNRLASIGLIQTSEDEELDDRL